MCRSRFRWGLRPRRLKIGLPAGGALQANLAPDVFHAILQRLVRVLSAGLALHLLCQNAASHGFRSGRRPSAIESPCCLRGNCRRGDPAGPCLRQGAPSDRAFGLGRRGAAQDCGGRAGHLRRGLFILRHEIPFLTRRGRHRPLTTASATGAARAAPGQRSYPMQRLAAHLARD